jgi:23S rRNA pseudouridine955/2504/2580 synthase/23S rRNA pseudouridine1911/1915/1917 synthase
MNFSIVFEDNHLLLVNKPAGLMVEPDNYGHPNLVQEVSNYLSFKDFSKQRIVANIHRLDRPVSGLIAFAKRKSTLKRVSRQFENREVDKIYLAITDHRPAEKEGKLTHWLIKDNMNKKALLFMNERSESEKVELSYKIISEKAGKYLWEIKLITGKFHQIRAQLAFSGCPIIGDKKYGSDEIYLEDQIPLHSWKLGLKYPEGEKKVFKADIPKSFLWDIFEEKEKA